VRRTARLARTDGRQDRLLTAACQQQAAQVRASLVNRDAASVNAAAARAWTAYEASRGRVLTAGQRARMQRILGAVMEHEMVPM
jgi:hypothetical protein